jgi:hypothetical protein
MGLQTKLRTSEPGDVYEQEADRVADQAMAASAHHAVHQTPPRVQRFSGQPTEKIEAVPASVHQALASPGTPLQPTLKQDMEQRFGYDFSQVRLRLGSVAEQSAQDVNAQAYTVGHNIVFNSGRFSPETSEGRLLLAHELTHVLQQTGPNQNRFGQRSAQPGLSGDYSLARKPLAGGTVGGPQTVKMMTREDARALLAGYIVGGVDDAFSAMKVIEDTLRMSFTLENASVRLRLLTAAISLLDEGGAASVLKALTMPRGTKQKHVSERFNRLDRRFRRPLLELLHERSGTKAVGEEEQQPAKPSKESSPKGKSAWVELDQGIFAYMVNAGMTVDDVAAQISRHPELPNILAQLNNVSRKTPLKEAHPIVVSINFIDREEAIHDMPEHIRSRIATVRQMTTSKEQYLRFVRVRGGPRPPGFAPFSMAAPVSVGFALQPLFEAFKRLGYAAGFVVGLLEGAKNAVVDLFEGALDMIKTVGELLYNVITGNLSEIKKMLMDWIDMLKLAWKNRSDIASDFMDKWEAEDGWDRGRFQGKVLGWVMMTVLIVFLTAGFGAIPQIAGKWKFVIDALKLADRVQDISTYAGAVGKLPRKATAIVRSKLGLKAEGVAETTVDKAAKETAEQGVTKTAKELPINMTQMEQPMMLAGKRHTLSIKRVGNKLKLWLCSNGCGELIERCDRLLQLVTNDVTRAQVESVRRRVQVLQGDLDSGKVTADILANELNLLRNTLEDVASKETSAVAKVVEGQMPIAKEPAQASKVEDPRSSEPAAGARGPYPHLSDVELVKRIAERTLDTSSPGVIARIRARSDTLRSRLRNILVEEFGANAFREYEFMVIGMPADKAGKFQLRSAGRVFGANDPFAAEIFAYRAVARTGKPGTVGGVLVVVERGAAKFPREIPIGDMPTINQIILEGEALDKLSRASDVVELPSGFFDE